MKIRIARGLAISAAIGLSVTAMQGVANAVTPESTPPPSAWTQNRLDPADGIAIDSRTADQLNRALNDLKVKGNEPAVKQFSSSYLKATNAFNDDLNDISEKFNKAETQDAASNRSVEAMSKAKDTYMNDLEKAKNRLAENSGGFGNGGDVAKDDFMNKFNAARDAFGNRFEHMKHEYLTQR